MVAAFLVVIAPKALDVGDDTCPHLHKANQARELQEEMAAFLQPVQDLAKNSGCVLQFKEGGAVAALGHPSLVSIASVGDRVAVFQGHLKNLAQLTDKYAHGPTQPRSNTSGHSSRGSSVNGDHHTAHASGATHPHTDDHPHSNHTAEGAAHTAPTVDLAPAGPADAAIVMTPAELVLAMYDVAGVALLAQLQGKFSFCMYDSKQMRVLAARDGSGAVPLLQARTSRDGLVLASAAPMLATCHDTLEFCPGHFKYGWHAEPRLFTPNDILVAPRQSAGSRNGSRRNSLDAPNGRHAAPHHVPSHSRPAGSRRMSNGDHNHVHGSPVQHYSSSPARAAGVPTPPGKRTSMDAGARGGSGRGHSGSGSMTHGASSLKAMVCGSPGGGVVVGTPPTPAGVRPGSAGGRKPLSAHNNVPAAGGAVCGGAVTGMANLNINAKSFVPTPSQLTT